MNYYMDLPYWSVPIIMEVKNGAQIEPPQDTTESSGAYESP